MAKPLVVFVLGGPGAGKGTQCTNIVKEFGYVHLSAGDLLRAERAKGSNDGELIEDYIKNGKIVPVEITIRLLQKAMENSDTKKFLIDGFPRNEDNLQGWEREMTEKVDVKCVLFFDCPKEECVRRVLKRGESSGRSDDNIESLTKRFNTYMDHTIPVIRFYEEKGLVSRINGEATSNQIFEEVKKLFREKQLI